jgi:hypothetical protein
MSEPLAPIEKIQRNTYETEFKQIQLMSLLEQLEEARENLLTESIHKRQTMKRNFIQKQNLIGASNGNG